MSSMRSLRFLAAACLMLAGCNNGGEVTNGSVNLSGSGSVVYLADQNAVGVFELFLASSGARLTPPLIPGGNVTSFALTPDKTAVVYIADQTTNDVFELYQVSIATPGVSVKLNGTLIPPQGDVASFAITPDGTSVVYLADQRIDQVFELYRVLFSNPGSSTLLNPALSGGQTVNQSAVTPFAVTPDSTKVVYIANQDLLNPNVNELYQVSFSNPLNSTKLNSPLVAGGNVVNFAIAPNSVSVVYLADEVIDQVFEIFPASVTGPGSGTSLNPPLLAGQNVTAFAVTPDSAAVIYQADETTTGVVELYRVLFLSPQVSVVKLNFPLTLGKNVSSFAIAANGLAVAYSANQDNAAVVELYYVLLSQPGASQKINPNGYVVGQNVSNFAITPDSSAVIYMANQTNVNAVQLYRVLISSLQQSSPPLNGTLASGGNVVSFSITPNSANVIYLADQTTFGIVELYAVNVGSPGTSSKLNGPLVSGGDVTAFTF
jgi:WD40 repeat protein